MTRTLTRCSLSFALTASLLLATLGTAAAQGTPESTAPTLNRALVARGVEDRLPVAAEAPFEADGERLYVYLEVNNPSAESVVYTVNWHHLDSDRRFSQTIEAGHSPRWRTWTYHRLSEGRVGNWHVEVVAPSGEVQAELDFAVVPGEPGPAELEAPTVPNT